jgi:hypothetical protein
MIAPLQSGNLLCVAVLLAGAWGPLAFAQNAADYIPQPGKFPPAGAGKFIAGELVFIDGPNRRGGLRLDGDGGERYHNGPLHYFALLPYCEVFRNGAPAELRDIPLGTHVQGYFFSPPVGEEATIPPLPKDQEKYEIKQNHAVSLEDDFSFYQRRGQAWKVMALNIEKGKLDVEPVGTLAKDGFNTVYTFDIDATARIWSGRTLVDLEQITPGQVVQFNRAWTPGWRDKEFAIGEIWLDEAGRKYAAEMQLRRHIAYQKQRWVPGWIDAVEHNDFGGGVVTLSLFGGLAPALYAELKSTQSKGFGVAAAEKTLRTWYHRGDKKIGQVLEWTEIVNPPPGDSGIRIRLKFAELLEGYRPGRCVRVKCDNWLFVTMPPEERIKSVADQQRSAVMGLP